MFRRVLPLIALLVLVGPSGPAGAGTEVLSVDPLADKDLNHFEKVGAWSLDDQSDDVHTLIVCARGKEPQSLKYRMRTFKQGFRAAMEVRGGSKAKGIELYVVPEQGEWINVPFSLKPFFKEGWHDLILTVENAQAWVKAGTVDNAKIAVPADQGLTFAIKIAKGNEVAFRKMKIQFLVVSEEQRAPEEGFVRIFDGKSLDGWVSLPEGGNNFKLAEQRIEGKAPMDMKEEARLVFTDASFRDMTLRFRAAQGAKNFILVGRLGTQDGAQRPVFTTVDSYFTGDKDWNDVEWVVAGQQVTLFVNGNQVWTQTTTNALPIAPFFLLGRDGNVILRDIRVKGTLTQAGQHWGRYAQESGAGAGAPPPQAGGGDGTSPGVPGGSHRGPASQTLFNGTDLDGWQAAPPDVWSVADGKVVGLTLEMKNQAQLVYTKLLFTDYRISFLVQKGSVGAKYVARAYPAEMKKNAVVVDLKPEWLTEEWTEVAMEVFGPKMTIYVAGKAVGEVVVPEDQGAIGFVIDANSAIGLKDIAYSRPAAR